MNYKSLEEMREHREEILRKMWKDAHSDDDEFSRSALDAIQHYGDCITAAISPSPKVHAFALICALRSVLDTVERSQPDAANMADIFSTVLDHKATVIELPSEVEEDDDDED